MDNGDQYREKNIFLCTKFFIMPVIFNKWMTINNVNMTSWVQLQWSCIIVENELF
jgi:hypothetical protein